MRSLWKSAACLGAAAALSMASVIPATPAAAQELRKPQEGIDMRSALQAAARTHLVEELERRMVRPTPQAILEADAKRIAEWLPQEKLQAVATGDGDAVETAMAEFRQARAASLGDATADLLFVPLEPCRIIDTRQGNGQILMPGEIRSFQVAGVTEFGPQGGTIGGCGVPAGGAEPVASAVVLNLIAIDPVGKGNMLAWAYGEPQPFASSINYQKLNPPMNIANGLIVPIAGTNLVPADLSLRVQFAASHAIADVTGYFTRFPIEQFSNTKKSITVVRDLGQIDLGDGGCKEVSSCTITAGAPGKVIVRAWTQIKLNHGTNVGGDRIAVGVKNSDPTVCSNNDQSINATDFEVSDSQGADPDIDWTMSHKRIYSQGTGTRTYYVNARMITGAGTGDRIENSRMVCTFIPD